MSESLVHRYAPGYPQGDADEVDRASTAWTRIANLLESLVDGIQGHVNGVGDGWSGAGFNAFASEWDELAATAREGIDQIRTLSTELTSIASAIRAAQRKYDATVATVGLTVTVGIALTVFTAGTSDVVAEEAAVAEATAAAAIIEEAAAVSVSVFSTILDSAISLATKFVVNFGINLAAQSVVDTVVYPDHNPFDHLNFTIALEGALTGTALGGIGGFATRLGPAGAIANGATRIGAVGAASAAITAGQEEFTQGRIDPMEVLFSGITAGGMEAGGILGGRFLRLGSRFQPGGETVLDDTFTDSSIPNGKPLAILPENETWREGEYTYQSDAEGRLSKAFGYLTLGSGVRNQDNAALVRSIGKAGDEAGHPIGAQFGAPAKPWTMFPQARNLNRGAGSAWTAMEREWKAALTSRPPGEVWVRVQARYANGDLRPTQFDVDYIINGTEYSEYFPNE